MRATIVIAIALVAFPARAQDTTRDLPALRARGVPAEIRSRTTKRNPETGRSTIAMIEAYTRGFVADAAEGLVYFLAESDDDGWIRPNAVALLEPADSLIRVLRSEGRDVSALVELNAKWFPRTADQGDEDAIRAWEDQLAARGVPVVLSRFEFHLTDEGGVLPSFALKNISNVTVAGVTIEVIGFNRFGDVVRDRDTGLATHEARMEGTIRPGDVSLVAHGDMPLWVNRATTCIEVRRIIVTFRDETTSTIEYQLKDARIAEDAYHTMGECSRPGSGP